MDPLAIIESTAADAATLSQWLVENERQHHTIARMLTPIVDCFAGDGRVLACGNGGSMCDAMHFAQELSGRYRRDRRALAALAIADPSHLTCVANDFGFEAVFARGVDAWGRAGDVLVLFTTSGNSPNIVAAAKAAKAKGMTVVGLLGRDGGSVKPLCDIALVVPAATSDRVQEVHIRAVHLLIELVERTLFPENYRSV